MEDVDTIYVPMKWDDMHWVGLAINLKLWYVEILDACPILTNNKDFFRNMAPVLETLPYIIRNLCHPQASQSLGVEPFLFKRMNGIYEKERSDD